VVIASMHEGGRAVAVAPPALDPPAS
jgi:hypothetical protein